jgi:pSer/pThr/pTyr-binding forkhead associated (FHA) protein
LNVKLEIMNGAQDGDEFRVRRSVTLGRDKSCDIPLVLDKYISRRHARLILERDKQIVLEDLGSTNGTFYNGERVVGKVELDNGDYFRTGRTWMYITW